MIILQKKILLATFLVLPLAASAGAPDPAQWDQHWKDCQNLRMPIFQAKIGEVQQLMQDGREWEGQVQKELRELTEVTNVTCKQWAENPNGDVPLQEFIRRFSTVANAALSLKQKARDSLAPKVDTWIKTETVDLARHGFRFDEFACGQSFLRTKSRIQANLVSIEEHFAVLKAKCPSAADAVIAKALAGGLGTAKYGTANGGPGRTPAGTSQNGKSDITGTKPLPTGGKKP